MYDLIVIGGGPAGITGALRARELNASVALVERGSMGGTCTNDGCAPTRVLAKAARLLRDSEQFAHYGISPVRPSIDLPALMARTQATVYRLHEKKQLLENLGNAGVDVFYETGPAQFADPHTLVLPDGRRLEAERFLICAGGHGRRLPIPGSELTLTHSDVWRMHALPNSLAIIGAAATGCQLATIFNAFGVRVSLFDIAPHILATEDAVIAEAVSNGFRARGIDVRAGIKGISAVEAARRGVLLRYTDEQGEQQTLDVDTIIQAVGWVGNIEQLNLPAAGVATQRGYIVTDEALQTSVPHIYAAGDINGRMMLVQSAAHEARTAAENALLGSARPFSHQIVPHGGFTDPEYGSVGLTEAQARAREDCIVAVSSYADMDRAVIDDRTEGVCKLIVSRESNQILGAHVAGQQALEVVQIAAAAMAGGMTIDRVAELELAYPTFTMIIGLTARRIVRELGLTPVSREWLTLRRVTHATAEWEKPRYAPLE